MYSEELYEVELTSDFIRVTHPQENDQIINWNEITEIRIRTTDEGPLLPDVWLELIGANTYCKIPQGNKSFDDLFERVSKWDGFDFDKYIESMGSTDNAVFQVWS